MTRNSPNGDWLKNLAKFVLPDFLVHYVSSVRARRRANAEHTRLRLLREEMRPDLMANAKVIPNRHMLLDLLPKNGIVAEIGVADGQYSVEILKRTKPKKIHLIDPWDSSKEAYSVIALNKVKDQFREEISSSIVEINRGYSTDWIDKFDDGYFDWVYIDAAHDYDNVKKDLESIWRKMKKGGYICGHDYINWVGSNDRYGIIEAVNQFANRTNSSLMYLTNQSDKHDSFALKVSE